MSKLSNMQLQKAKVLLVEDQEIPRRVITMILAELGCMVHTASTGQDALTFVQNDIYDLVLMDIGLPDMSGLEVIKNIRQLNIEVPITVVSAYSDEAYRNQARLLGIEDFIVKPLTEEICATLVEKLHQKDEQQIQ